MQNGRHRGLGTALAIALATVGGCGGPEPEKPPEPKAGPVEPGTPATATRVSGVEVVGGAARILVAVGPLDGLKPAERKQLYRYYTAAVAGEDLYAAEIGPFNLAARRLFEGILSVGKALPGDLQERIVPYAERFILYRGERDPWTGERIEPPFIPGELASAAEIAVGRGVDIGLADFRAEDLGANQLDQISALVSALRPQLFDPDAHPDPDAGAAPVASGTADAKRAQIEEALPDALVAPGNPATEAVIGLRDRRTDPRTGRSLFGALVAVRDPDRSEKIRRLSDLAPVFEKELARVARIKVKPVPWEACQAVIATGWRALDIGNEAIFPAAHRSLYLANLADAIAAFRGLAPRQRQAEEALFLLSRVIGGGGLRADPAGRLQRWSAPIAAAGADLVALYLAFSERLRETGLVADEAGASEVYDLYAGQAFLAPADPGNPDSSGDAARQGRVAVLRWLVEKGAVEIAEESGRLSIRVVDYGAMRSKVAELLAQISRIAVAGDARGARELIERYGDEPAPWRAEAAARLRGQGLPLRAVFAYPKIEPRFDDQGGISELLVRSAQ